MHGGVIRFTDFGSGDVGHIRNGGTIDAPAAGSHAYLYWKGDELGKGVNFCAPLLAGSSPMTHTAVLTFDLGLLRYRYEGALLFSFSKVSLVDAAPGKAPVVRADGARIAGGRGRGGVGWWGVE